MSTVEIIKKPVEKIGNSLKKKAWMSILESVAMVILGVLLVAWPDVVVKVLAYVIGAFFVVKGLYQVVNYFVVQGQNDFFNNDLLWGVISVILGVVLFFLGDRISEVFRMVVGIWMIYEALVKMNTAVKMGSAKIPVFKYVLILAIVMLVLGAFVTFCEGAIPMLIGWMMVVNGIAGICEDVAFVQNVDKIVEKITH